MEPISILQFEDPEVSEFDCEKDNHVNLNQVKVKIDECDIQSEIDYWNSTLICYVIGANPPPYVMEGHVRGI